jgi:hypothetical protein
MKRFLLPCLAGALTVIASAAETNPLSGKWQIHNTIAGNESNQSCTLSQKENEITGTCGDGQTLATIAGKVEDRKITWTLKTEYNGSPITLDYTGQLGPEGRIEGTVTVEEFNVDGSFTANPSK